MIMKIGSKVCFEGTHGDLMIGYLVNIELDVIDEEDDYFRDPEESATYTIRIFKPFYKDGYADFQRSYDEIALY